MTNHIYAMVKLHAAELGTCLAEFARRLFKGELDAPVPQGGIDSICGMVTGTPFDIARDGMPVIGEPGYPYCG